jgi:hypothetical protein
VSRDEDVPWNTEDNDRSLFTIPLTEPSMTRLPFPSIPVLVLSIPLSSCSADASSTVHVTVRDSAGIVIVENADEIPPDGGGWAISPEPRLQVGALGGPEDMQLYRVAGAVRLEDGRIALVNAGTPDLRIFGSEGKHQVSFGRKGEGPGEFSDPVLVGTLPGDTLVVVDRTARVVNLFHPSGGFIRGSTADPDLLGYLLPKGMFSSGSVVIWGMVHDAMEKDGFARRPVRFRSLSRNGTLETDFGVFPGEETIAHTFRSGEVVTGAIASTPFGRSGSVAAGADRLFYSSQDSYEIRVYDMAGKLGRLIRLARPPFPVTSNHIETYTERRLAGADSENQRRAIRRILDETPRPEFHPAHGELFSDKLGYLWVEDYRLPGVSDISFTIFDPDGRLSGSVTLPSRFQILEIGPDYLLALCRDEMDVEYVRMYGLTRPGRQG